MKASIDKHNKFTSKPTSSYANINQSIVNGWCELIPTEFASLITQGCSFSCGHFKYRRASDEWLGQQLFAIDVDDLGSPTPTQAVSITSRLFGVKPMLVYNSFSSNATNNKYRLVIAANTVISDREVCQSILRGLIAGLKTWRDSLLRDGEHRYTKLSHFCYWLMNQHYMSAELAKYIVEKLIDDDDELADHYITDWDKDYADVTDNIIDWCEVKYA